MTALDILNALRAIAIQEAQAAHIDAHDRTGDRNRALAAGRKKAYQEIVERIDQLLPTIGDGQAVARREYPLTSVNAEGKGIGKHGRT